MSSKPRTLRVGYIAKMFPRLSETFVLNEILELERQGVEVVIFSVKKPNEGRFHPQLAQLKARVFYLEDLDTRKWASWIGKDWDRLAGRKDKLWPLVEEYISAGNPRGVEYVWWAAWVACRADEFGLDRLHAHFASLPSTIAYLAHRVSGIPFSFIAHAKDIYVYTPEETRLREKIEASDGMITVTNYNKRHVVSLLPGIDESKIRVLYNGIYLDSFSPDKRIEREVNHILGVGRLVPKKGFGTLLEACALLKERGVPFKCTIAGGGTEADALERQRQQLGLDEVELTGPVTADQVRNYMQRATLFCLPCTTAEDKNVDALPTVLLESLASGIPSISTAISGVPEIIDSGVDGELVPPDDAEALAQALEKVLTSPSLREHYVERGMQKAADRFDIRKNVARLHDFFLGTGEPRRERGASLSSDKKLLYVCGDRGIPFGGAKGASVHVREFLEAMQQRGAEVAAAVARRDMGSSYQPEYPVHVFEGNDWIGGSGILQQGSDVSGLEDVIEFTRNDGFYSMLKRQFDARSAQAVYERYSLFGVAGLAFAREMGKPFLLEVNSPLVKEASRYRGLLDVDLARRIEKLLFESADHVFVVSDALREYVAGIAEGTPITVLPNGVDPSRFTGKRDDAWRRRVCGDNGSDFVVGFVGRVRPWHGLEQLIGAMCEVVAQRPSAHLCVVGRTDGTHEALKGEVARLKLNDNVSFLGEIPMEDIPAAMAAMDVVVAPYPSVDDFYFSPLKVFEYMAAGKPIVATQVGQVADVLEHEHSALIVLPGDPSALGKAIVRIMHDPPLGTRLGDNARSEVTARHTWAQRIGVVKEVLDEISRGQHVETVVS